MAALFGARNAPSAFVRDDHIRRVLPTKHFEARRYCEVVIQVRGKEREYLSVCVCEDRLYLVRATDTDTSALPCLLLSTVGRPQVGTGQADFLADQQAVQRSTAIVLSPLPQHVKTHESYMWYTFMKPSKLLFHLEQAWYNFHLRQCTGLPIAVAMNSPAQIPRLFDQILTEINAARTQDEIMALFAELEGPVLHDRVLKQLCLDTSRGLAPMLINDLFRYTSPKMTVEARMAVPNLECLVSVLSLFRHILFNSEAVAGRHCILLMRSHTIEQLLTALTAIHPTFAIVTGARGGAGSADAAPAVPYTEEQVDLQYNVLHLAGDIIIELNSVSEQGYLDGHDCPEIPLAMGSIPSVVQKFVPAAMSSLLELLNNLVDARAQEQTHRAHMERLKIAAEAAALTAAAAIGSERKEGREGKGDREDTPSSKRRDNDELAPLLASPVTERSRRGRTRRSSSLSAASGRKPSVAETVHSHTDASTVMTSYVDDPEFCERLIQLVRLIHMLIMRNRTVMLPAIARPLKGALMSSLLPIRFDSYIHPTAIGAVTIQLLSSIQASLGDYLASIS